VSVFVDTNILVYAYDKGAGQKYERAMHVISGLCKGSDRPTISTQVIQELHAQLLRFGYSTVEAINIARLYLSWRVIAVTTELLERSFELRIRHGLSIWDSSIVAAAQLGQAEKLMSEDFQTGQKFDALAVINPLK